MITSMDELDMDLIKKLVIVDTKTPQRLKHIQVKLLIQIKLNLLTCYH